MANPAVLFSSRALCLALLSNFIKCFASPLALVCNDVTLWCLISSSKAKSVISFEVNVGPLSVSTCFGVPWIAKTSFSLFCGRRVYYFYVLESCSFVNDNLIVMVV